MSRTILIMVGGTGGHIFPGLAVAQVLSECGWRVVWMGVRTGMEAQIVPRSGYELVWVDFQGVRGRGLGALLALPLRLLRAMWQAATAIRRIKPDVVLGMGGYVALPGGMMAAALGRPLVIHEQNAVAGTTSRLLAGIAERVLTSFDGAFAPKHRALVTGNPIRSGFTDIPRPEVRFAGRAGPLRLMILGGSLGAQALNEVLPAAFALIPETERPHVVHQTGARHIDSVRVAYSRAGVDAHCEAFIDDIAAELASADLVVCRAGATTLAEIAAVGVGSILVPFPFAVDDHQTSNAQALVRSGAAILLPQASLCAEGLADVLRSLDRGRLLAMACSARALGRPQAACEVAQICEHMASGHRR